MQMRDHVSTKTRRAKGGLLNQSWLPNLLMLVLMLLIAVFLVSLRYHENLVHYAGVFLERVKKTFFSSFGLNTNFTESQYRRVAGGFVAFSCALPIRLCEPPPANRSLPFIRVLESRSLVAE